MKRFPVFLISIFTFSLLHAGERHTLLWFDATANFVRLSSVDSVRIYLDKTKAAGFTDIVVDVKPTTAKFSIPAPSLPK